MLDRHAALVRLRAALAAGWPDPRASVADAERALGGEPDPRLQTVERLAASQVAVELAVNRSAGASLAADLAWLEGVLNGLAERLEADRREASAELSRDTDEQSPPYEPRGARDRRAWTAMARHKAGPAIELAHALLDEAGWPRERRESLLRDAASVEDVHQALRGIVHALPPPEDAG